MDNYAKLEKHHRVREHSPYAKLSYKGYEVALSDGGPYTDVRKVSEYPNGWYEASYTIFFGGHPLFESWLEFDGFHDLNLTHDGRKKARINSAKKTAFQIIDDWESQGFQIDKQSLKRA
jgi:hypothetical protein